MSDDNETGDDGKYDGFVFEDDSLESESELAGIAEGDDRHLVAVVLLLRQSSCSHTSLSRS